MKIKDKMLLVIFIIGLLFLMAPVNGYAKNTIPDNSSNNKSLICKNGNSANTKCKNNYGIDIKTQNYSKVANYQGNGIYANETYDRRVLVEVKNKDVKYKVVILHGKSGTLTNNMLKIADGDNEDDDDDSHDLNITKISENTLDSDVELVTANIGPGTNHKDGKYEYDVKDGEDALVIVYLKKNHTMSCIKKDSKPETTVNFKCMNGKKTSVTSDGYVTLSGIAAAEFVQNPKNNIVIKNLRSPLQPDGSNDLKQACKNAKEAIYQDKDGKEKNSKYTINKNSKIYGDNYAEAKNKYVSEIYNHILGQNYCDKTEVAFNLKESQIVSLSNRLLETFAKQWKLSHKESSDGASQIKTAEEIEEKARLEAESLGLVEGENLFDVENTPNLNVSTACSSKAVDRESTNFMAYQKSSVKKKLSNNETKEICSTFCYELLTVKYDPPVASIAGLCFSYTVTVQSKVECGMTDKSGELLNGNNPNSITAKVKKEMCAPVAICSGDGKHTQAGPSDEFDDCIQKCDGGKYSQQCINKCYDNVYNTDNISENKNKNDTTFDVSAVSNNALNNSISSLDLLNTEKQSDILVKVTNWNKYNFSEEELEKYNTEGTVIDKCKTSNIDKNLDYCAAYFFQAKTIKPCGKYNSDGTIWKQYDNVCNLNDDHTSVATEIARAAPFYVRDEDSTKNLIQSLLGSDPDSKRGYKIDNTGIKRQYKDGWSCTEECEFTGCSNSYALSAKQFVKGLKISVSDNDNYDDDDDDDMDKIAEGLEECNSKVVCEKAKESTFTISINNKRENKEDKHIVVNGKNCSGKEDTDRCEPETSFSTDDKEVCNERPFSMFVPERNIDDDSTNGILGLCYGKKLDYAHYKTTITFPGSWINYKARKISYSSCEDGSEKKENQFCSAYDSSNINDNWWKWRMEIKDENGNPYQHSEPEEKDNITSVINNFGEYNWHIKYSCFYAIFSDDCTDGDKCQNGTGLQDYTYKVIKPGELFTEGSNQKQGFNWTSAATVTEKSGVNTSDPSAKTYTINPQKYVDYINNFESDEKIYDTKEDDYYIYLSSDGVKHISQTYKRSYADYDGLFKEDANVKGLVRYTSSLLDELNGYGNKDIYIKKVAGIEQVNNNYSDLESLID